MHRLLERLRKRSGVTVISVGPGAGMSVSWGQRVLDGSILPTVDQAYVLSSVVLATHEDGLALVTLCATEHFQRGGGATSIISKLVAFVVAHYRGKKRRCTK